jgi:TetR/AcrR family transcriptional regulator
MGPLPTPTLTPPARRGRPRQATRAKLDQLLAGAAEVIAKRGYEGATIRDVGERVGVSLAGMYYYFTNKEHLLYQIQRRTFDSLLEAQTDRAGVAGSAGERLRRLITGHLAFFAAHPNEMKVCTFELDSLTGASYRSVLDIRRRYYRVMASVVAEAMDGPGRKGRETARSRMVTLSLFGMLNWVFMWYDPSKDGTIDALGGEMTQLILRGISPERNR